MIDENIILAFQCDHPDEAEAYFQEGVQSERERITNLLKLSHPATSAIVKAAIQSGAEPSDIFGQCFTARERAANSNQPAIAAAPGAPTRNTARAQTTTAQPAQPIRSDVNVQQRSAESERRFGQALKTKLDCARAHWLRGRAKREAIAVATAPASSV